MRKLLSVVLTVALLLSSFAAGIISAVQADEPRLVSHITFSVDYYANTDNYSGHFKRETVDDGHGEVLHLSDTALAAATHNTHRVFRLQDENGRPALVEGGVYRLTYAINARTATLPFYVGVGTLNVETGYSGWTLAQTDNRCYHEGATDGWTTGELTFTADASYTAPNRDLFLRVFGDKTPWVSATMDVLFDDVKIEAISEPEPPEQPAGTITFDEAYYQDAGTAHMHTGYLEIVDDEDPMHGKVLKSHHLSPYPDDAKETYAAAFRLIGEDGQPYQVQEGVTYLITFDAKIVSMPEDCSTAKLGMLVKTPDGQQGFNKTKGNGLMCDETTGLNSDELTLGKWFPDAYITTPTRSGDAALLFYHLINDKGIDGLDVRVDNVRITPYEMPTYHETDFSSDYYAVPCGATHYNSSYVSRVTDDEEHGDVMKVSTATLAAKSNYRRGLMLADANGVPFRVENGKEYELRYQIKSSYAGNYHIGLYNLGQGLNNGNSGAKWHDGFSTHAAATNGWENASFTFRVADDADKGNLSLAVYADATVNNANFECMIDNVRLREVPTETDVVTFSGAYYDTPAERNGGVEHAGVRYNQGYLEVEVDDAAHGRVMSCYSFMAKPNPNVESWASAFRLANDEGETFPVQAGKTYTVTYDVKVNMPDAFRISAICKPAFPSDPVKNSQFGNKSTTNNVVDAYEQIAASTDNVWRTGGFSFTADVDGEASLVFLSTTGSRITYEKETGNKASLDNIRIVKDEDPGLPVEITYHNFKGPDDADATTRTGVTGASYDKPYCKGYVFEGWFSDETLATEAPTLITSSCVEVWAKWSEDTRTPESIVNTYDDSFLDFEITADDNGIHTVTVKENGVYEDFSTRSNVTTTTDPSGKQSNALHFDAATNYTSQWPPMVRIYDNIAQNRMFVPNPNSAYRISLKYRVDTAMTYRGHIQLVQVSAGISNPNGAYNLKNILLTDLANPYEVTEGWVEANATFYTGDSVRALTLTLVSDRGDMGRNDADVWIDDIKIEEILGVAELQLVTDGGSGSGSVKCLPGEEIPAIAAPTKAGSIFTGWYTDYARTKPFSAEVMPEENLTLYAAYTDPWTEIQPYHTGFEPGTVTYPNKDGVSAGTGNAMSEKVYWESDSAGEAYSGTGRLYFDLLDGGIIQSSTEWPAAALLNPDGSNYQLVAGKRYHIRFAYRFSGNIDGGQVINLVTSSQVPTGSICSTNATVLGSITNNSQAAGNEIWGEFETYLNAQQTEKLYIAVYSSGVKMCYVNIDDFRIEEATPDMASVVKWYNNDDPAHPKLIAETIGAIGSEMIEQLADATNAETAFNGWRDENGNVCLINHFPAEDTSFYTSRVPFVEPENPKSDFSKPMVIDFEDRENARIFYADGVNSSRQEQLYLVTDDPEGAHSGQSYFHYKNAGQWTPQYYRSWYFYDKNSSDHRVHLEPNSVYRVNFWIKLDQVGSINLYLAAFSSSTSRANYEIAQENYMTDAGSFRDLNQWVQRENTVVTGDDPVTLGFVLYGGYLTASIDDITITKLSRVSITYDTNGGSEMPATEQMSHSTAVQPADPVREGYTFGGWYTDKACTKPFSFKDTVVTSNLTLYAKWTAIPVEKPVYETVVTYEEETNLVDKPVPDPELDEPITYLDNDEIGERPSTEEPSQTVEPTENESGFPWWIIVVIAAVVVLAAAGLTVGLVLAKKRKGAGAR